MKFGVYANNYNDFGDPSSVEHIAMKAENVGFDGIFLADNIDHGGWLNDTVDPWIMLAAIAAKTTKLKLGTWITPVARRLPWQLARNVATLDQISGGRVILGTGLGFPADDFEKYGTEYNPKELGDKYDEGLEIINGLWKDEDFSFEGEYYTLKDANLQPKPVQKPRVPILIGAKWPNKKPIRRGAKWDGLMPVAVDWPKQISKDEIRKMIKYYQSHRENEGLGDIVLPILKEPPVEEFIPFCQELGVTWLLYLVSSSKGSLEENLEKMDEFSSIMTKYQ